MTVTNDISGDQRLHRFASTLQDSGWEVTVVGRKLPYSKPLPKRPYSAIRLQLSVNKGKLFYLMFNLRLLWLLIKHRPDIIHANDLDTLLAGSLAARWTGAKLVYDSHEYFTEVPELIHRPTSRKVWLWLERRLFPKADVVLTVNDTLADIYAKLYQREVLSVRNVPFRRELTPQAGESILIYQGALNVGRGIELMIKAMKWLPNYRLWIIGRGDMGAKLRTLTEAQGLDGRVEFKGFVAPADLPKLTTQAKIGFSLEENLGANYRVASPNKVYDYIQDGVPIIVSDLPVMSALVQEHQVGKILPEDQRKPDRLASLIKSIAESEDAYRQLQANCRVAATKLNWETESQKLLNIYRHLAPVAQPQPSSTNS
ncbi:glycosyltransferase family 4 protein [Pontibacter sp. G13]|uniref:glycosyltransferase family 4 protein n=1 Tax=Pontibacter sp. G13 TaxID=3074898 RepID=UPI00288BB092|nr:glycosyltransferase family 4 protein [Pontibacter sp. G13]WNJ20382.1 glycosyltransferase family 4 protein [Pontibacter sp. G13]